jgi:hypothetical protein
MVFRGEFRFAQSPSGYAYTFIAERIDGKCVVFDVFSGKMGIKECGDGI